jgi:hypothetical protein
MARLHCVPLRTAKRLPHEHVSALDQPTPPQTAALPIKQNVAPKKAKAAKPKLPTRLYQSR